LGGIKLLHESALACPGMGLALQLLPRVHPPPRRAPSARSCRRRNDNLACGASSNTSSLPSRTSSRMTLTRLPRHGRTSTVTRAHLRGMPGPSGTFAGRSRLFPAHARPRACLAPRIPWLDTEGRWGRDFLGESDQGGHASTQAKIVGGGVRPSPPGW
jgi:hypothetical protein